MAELYLFDQDDNFITILSKDEGLVDTWFKDYENHLIDEPFVFNVDSNSPLLQHIKEENQVAFYDRDNDLRLMRMKELYEVTSKDGHNIRVKCEPSFLELYDHFIEDKRITNVTAQTALNRALEGSRYIGEVTVDLGLATDNFYWISGIEAIFKIISTWGGALKDTITLDEDNKIIERKIWIVQRLGADNGLIVEPDYNAETISRNTLSYTETALWGQGASLETDNGGFTRYITFEDVEWKVSNGDPVDKPLGQKWVGDPQALAQHGYLHNGVRQHKFGHFSNQEYETPEELLMATWLELQERKLKEIIHEATIYESDKKVSLGDTVTILDRNYNKPIELQSQITGLEYDALEPDEEIKIVVGKYIDMNEDPLQKDVDDLKEQVRKPRPTEPINNGSFPDIKPGIPINVTATGAFQTIQLFWDYDSNVYISHYEVYGSQISDFVPDEQHLLYRGRVSSFSHEVDTDVMWYYYIRAVNTRGTVGEFSNRVSASSVRIISDDILFGSIIADHLSNNLDIAHKLSQNTIDSINEPALSYTDQEVKGIKTDLENRLDGVDGTIFSINQEVDELLGFKQTTITRLSNIDGTLSAHETAITQNATDINLKASQTSVDDLSGRVSNAETTLNLLPGQFDLKVSKDKVVSEINATPESIRIASKLIHLSGTSLIDDAVIGTAAIANLAVTNGKIANLAVGTGQIQNLAVTTGKIANLAVDDAKIANVAVNKLLAGEIDTSKIKIRGGSAIDYTLIDGSYFESRGRFNRTWRGSTATHDIKLRFENGYLRARNDTLNRSVYLSDYGISTQLTGDNASGTLEFFSRINSSAGRGVTLTSEGVTTIEANGGAIHLDALTTINAKVPIYAPGFITSTTNAYIGTDNVLHVVNKGFVDGSSGSPIYRDLRAYDIYGRGFISSVTHAYIGTDDELRVVNKGLTEIYRDVRALGFIGNRVGLGTHVSGAVNFHVQPAGNGEVQITDRSGNGSFRPLRSGHLISQGHVTAGNNGAFESSAGYVVVRSAGAGIVYLQSDGHVRTTRVGQGSSYVPIRSREFITDTSLRENKKNIDTYNVCALDVFRNAQVYQYHRSEDSASDKKQLGLMIDEFPVETHSETNDAFGIYGLLSFVGKGVKDLVHRTDNHKDRLDIKDLQIQYLQQKVALQDKKIKHLESLLEVA